MKQKMSICVQYNQAFAQQLILVFSFFLVSCSPASRTPSVSENAPKVDSSSRNQKSNNIEIYDPLPFSNFGFYEDFEYNLEGEIIFDHRVGSDENGNMINIEEKNHDLPPIYLSFQESLEDESYGNNVLFVDSKKSYFKDDSYITEYSKLSPESIVSESYSMLSPNFKPFCVLRLYGNSDVPLTKMYFESKYVLYSDVTIKIAIPSKAKVAVTKFIFFKVDEDRKFKDYGEWFANRKKDFFGTDRTFQLQLECASTYSGETGIKLIQDIFQSVFKKNSPKITE